MFAVILAGFLTVSLVRPIGFEPMAYSFGGQDATQQVPEKATDIASGNSEAQRAALDWPSITAAAVGQVLGDGGTTVYFLTGHGQSASHPGPCVEANPLFQPSNHQIAKIMVTKAALIGGLVAFNYLAEHWRAPESAKTVRWVSRGLNYFAAGEGFLATFHNIGHCGI